MSRPVPGKFANSRALELIGLSHNVLQAAISETYDLLDRIDKTLVDFGVYPLSQTVELANLSSMIGNILASAIAQHSNGLFRRNGPHKYPDLLSNGIPEIPNIELKMALETNKPKGHLAKPGYYITCRYVLCNPDGSFVYDKYNRAITPFIWELRCGLLDESHFNISNTDGDSGKTAVVNVDGMKALKVIYVDLQRAPLSRTGRIYADYVSLLESGT
jgi:hypothetical protein